MVCATWVAQPCANFHAFQRFLIALPLLPYLYYRLRPKACCSEYKLECMSCLSGETPEVLTSM